jgi:hypothetical protein
MVVLNWLSSTPRNTNAYGGSYSRVAMPIEALSEADLDGLERSKIPEETKRLDQLVHEK